jgi:dipeptidase E
MPSDLAVLLGKPLSEATMALIPNAQDYFSERPRNYQLSQRVSVMESLGLKVDVVDLREYGNASALKEKLKNYSIVWATGGNTFCLRYEMRRSGFEEAIKDLLSEGVIYGGDSAGALVAGTSIGGIESADIPQFADEIIVEGLRLVPYVVMPHVDNPEFADVLPVVRDMYSAENEMIELKDSQAVIFNDTDYKIVGV